MKQQIKLGAFSVFYKVVVLSSPFPPCPAPHVLEVALDHGSAPTATPLRQRGRLAVSHVSCGKFSVDFIRARER